MIKSIWLGQHFDGGAEVEIEGDLITIEGSYEIGGTGIMKIRGTIESVDGHAWITTDKGSMSLEDYRNLPKHPSDDCNPEVDSLSGCLQGHIYGYKGGDAPLDGPYEYYYPCDCKCHEKSLI